MSKQELIAEHEKLVAVLKSPDHGDDLKEAKEQEAELKGYKGNAGGAAKAAKPKATPPAATDISPAEAAEAERQYQEVKVRYQGTPGWLKAPNGKPSKLNERQWVLVRTENFRKWFGEWEASAAVLDAVNLQLQGWAGSATELSLMARDVYTHELQGDKIDNASLGADIVFSSEGKGEAFGARGKMRNPIRAELVRVLREIVHGAAKVAESKPDARREADTTAFHTLVMPLLVNDQLFSVKVTVREARLVPEGGIPHKFYDVTALQIEESPGVHGFAGHRAPGRPAPSEASKVSVAALAKTFKIDVASSVSKVVDASGEPLIAYHGTGADISGFDDQGKSTQGEGLGTGLGHFFATSTEYASDYAKMAQGNVIPSWLAIKQPLVIPDREGMSAAFRIASDAYGQQHYGKTLYELENSEDDADYRTVKDFYDQHLGAPGPEYFGRKNRFVRQQLQAMGYDGIVFKNDRQLSAEGGEVLVAFTAPQVKSAIGNAGTFRPDLAHLSKAWPRTPIFFRNARIH